MDEVLASSGDEPDVNKVSNKVRRVVFQIEGHDARIFVDLVLREQGAQGRIGFRSKNAQEMSKHIEGSCERTSSEGEMKAGGRVVETQKGGGGKNALDGSYPPTQRKTTGTSKDGSGGSRKMEDKEREVDSGEETEDLEEEGSGSRGRKKTGRRDRTKSRRQRRDRKARGRMGEDWFP